MEGQKTMHYNYTEIFMDKRRLEEYGTSTWLRNLLINWVSNNRRWLSVFSTVEKYVLYTDNSILAGPNNAEVEKAIMDLEKLNLISLSKATSKTFWESILPNRRTVASH